ncbi:MAG TPA: alpha/beta hydrolase [Candidatus Saccharimonadales bacterium]|nr:alpha/beta hydrolase [Candidatus Saccharimonadales bacterium]
MTASKKKNMYKNPYENQSGTITNESLVSAGFTEQQFNTGIVNINYVSGPNNGPALVLVPAQMGTWESYTRVLVPLSQHFQVYAIDVRGHGKSSWTPGDYNWTRIGEDMRAFLEGIVQRPAIISGNSSGGIIAMWCGANLPELTAGVILEDAPVFSVEMPRFKEQDKFVYKGLEHAVWALGDLQNRDLANYFKGQEMPVSATRTKRFPDGMVRFISKLIKKEEAANPGKPLELRKWYIPGTLRLLFKSLSQFDPDFARAFVDGRMYEGLNHAEALQRITCPLLVLHATWHRYPAHGLVGAMDDADARRIKELVPHSAYKKIPANHVIHMYKPKEFVAAVEEFAATVRSS